jgi:DNA-binding transcriptional MerR regulator
MSPTGQQEAARVLEKSPDAFRTISEVADDLDLPQHVLRFWETRFSQIKPLKRGGGRRYYRPDDVDLLKGIRHLLYGEGYTIKGVQRILKEDGLRFVQSVGRGEQSVQAPPSGMGVVEAGENEPDDRPSPVRFENRLHSEATEPSREARHPRADNGTAARAPEARSASDIAKLRAVLDDLLECERVLATLQVPQSTEEPTSER